LIFRIGKLQKALLFQLPKTAFITQGYSALNGVGRIAEIEIGIIQISIYSDLPQINGVLGWQVFFYGLGLATKQYKWY
jgi:hypothetical protein